MRMKKENQQPKKLDQEGKRSAHFKSELKTG